MEGPEPDIQNGSEYIEKKRAELKMFFNGIKLPQESIDRAIENELRPLKEGKKPYIAASYHGEVKSEYEVMTGQPFTKVEEHTRPLTTKEIKDMIEGSPILEEKARQIQIASTSDDRKEVAIPMSDVNLSGYADMRKEIDSAEGDKEKISKINLKHMQSLVTSLNDFQAKQDKTQGKIKIASNDNQSENSNQEDEEYEAIEREVSKYTDKTYETRYQETKDMLMKMADSYDDPNTSNKPIEIITYDNVLKDSSVHLVKGQRRKTCFEEVKESYSINAAMNISMKDNPVAPDLSGKSKTSECLVAFKQEEEITNTEEIFPLSFKAKLKDTEKYLRDINSVLNNSPSSLNYVNTANEKLKDKKYSLEELHEHSPKADDNQEPTNKPHRFDERMEQTLQNALENIYEIGNNDNHDNKEMEFGEMKNLARNIVEGAENLSTLIREDITNKLNSMNELLDDVNEALENSRKSNIAYRQIQKEGDNLRREKEVNAAKNKKIIEAGKDLFTEDSEERKCNVTDSQIDDIHVAIGNLNAEIKCHEIRINQSKERYEERNKECKSFIQEVDAVLKKSNAILHPVIEASQELTKSLDEVNKAQNDIISEADQTKNNAKLEKVRKELWDIDLSEMEQSNKKMDAFKKQELERNKRIDNLLFDIKDKMKDNKEVLRLANNLLRREENKKKQHQEGGKIHELETSEIDPKAQGDPIRVDEKSGSGVNAPVINSESRTEKGW